MSSNVVISCQAMDQMQRDAADRMEEQRIQHEQDLNKLRELMEQQRSEMDRALEVKDDECNRMRIKLKDSTWEVRVVVVMVMI